MSATMTEHTMTRGDTKELVFTVLDGDLARANLTNFDLAFTAKRRRADAQDAAIIKKTSTVDDGITLLDQDNEETAGQAVVRIAPGDTQDLEAYDVMLLFDFQVMDGEDIYTTERGTLLVMADVTTTA